MKNGFDDTKTSPPTKYPTSKFPEHPSVPYSPPYIGPSKGPDPEPDLEPNRRRKRTFLEEADAGFPGTRGWKREQLQRLADLLRQR